MVVQFFKFIFCTVFFWTIFPLLYIILSPFYLFRYILCHVQKYVHPDWVGIVNIRDTFLYEDLQNPKGLTHAIPMVAYLLESERIKSDENLTPLERTLNLFRNVLQKKNSRGESAYEKLTFYPQTWWGFPFWKIEPNFKLEKHIRMCEEFVGKELSEEDLEIFVGDYNQKPFPEKFSPWEVLVFRMKSQKDEPPKFTLYFRFHHILMDGLSMAQMGNLIDVESAKDKLKTISPYRSTWKTKIVFVVKLIVFLGYDLVKLLITDIDKNAWKIPQNQLTNKTHMISTKAVDYEFVREASKRQGVSPTAIFFGCFAGGVHNFLKQEGESIPKVMRLAVAMPVPNHPLEGMVNHWTFAEVDLPVNDPNPSSRVRKVENHLLFLRKRATTGILWVITPLHAAIPYKLLNYLANNHMTTLLGSNFPGPRTMIKFVDNYDLESFRGYLPRLRGNTAVGLASYTYNGKVRFSVCIDKGLMPKRASARQLLELIQNELNLLARGEHTNDKHLKSN